MIYAYDLLINLSKNRIYEFYEWNEDDEIIHIKKIPLYKVSDDTMDKIYNNKIKLDIEELKIIWNKAEIFKNKNKNLYSYLLLLADSNKVLAVLFDENGVSISKSKLLLEEEDEILELTTRSIIKDIKYTILEKMEKEKFLTRNEERIKDYLIKDLEKSYQANNINKIKFIYNEYFNKISSNIDKMYQELIKEIGTKNSIKDKELYNIMSPKKELKNNI